MGNEYSLEDSLREQLEELHRINEELREEIRQLKERIQRNVDDISEIGFGSTFLS
jgi:vacuolar-type H+-ATPase subunit E/Vma4